MQGFEGDYVPRNTKREKTKINGKAGTRTSLIPASIKKSGGRLPQPRTFRGRMQRPIRKNTPAPRCCEARVKRRNRISVIVINRNDVGYRLSDYHIGEEASPDICVETF